MEKDSQTEIISTLNSEGLRGSYISTFIYLWGYEENMIDKPQWELASEMNLKARTLRSHLYKLREYGLIDYSNNPNSNKIYLKRFKH